MLPPFPLGRDGGMSVLRNLECLEEEGFDACAFSPVNSACVLTIRLSVSGSCSNLHTLWPVLIWVETHLPQHRSGPTCDPCAFAGAAGHLHWGAALPAALHTRLQPSQTLLCGI